MIKQSELRIGNLVNTPDPHLNPFKVESIEVRRIGCSGAESLIYWDRRVLNPLPLSDEWLLKFGFQKKSGWDDMEFYVKEWVELELTDRGFEFNDRIIPSVHRLQNLYQAITGEELQAP